MALWTSHLCCVALTLAAGKFLKRGYFEYNDFLTKQQLLAYSPLTYESDTVTAQMEHLLSEMWLVYIFMYVFSCVKFVPVVYVW